MDWLAGVNWPELLTAIATVATAALLYLQHREAKRSREPFVECEVQPHESEPWARIFIRVRNFHPHEIRVREVRLRRPRNGAIFTEDEAYPPPRPNKNRAVSNAPPKRVAAFVATVHPCGVGPASLIGKIPVHDGDQASAVFYFSVPGGGRVRLRMDLICEVRSRVVRQLTIPIKRTITLCTSSNHG